MDKEEAPRSHLQGASEGLTRLVPGSWPRRGREVRDAQLVAGVTTLFLDVHEPARGRESDVRLREVCEWSAFTAGADAERRTRRQYAVVCWTA